MNNKLKWTYRFTDMFLYPIAYYVVRYRRTVVRKNLVSSFPELSQDEIVHLEKQFYHHFSDIVAEVLFASHASKNELAECIEFIGLDDVEKKAALHGGVIYMLGHLGNWELTADVQHRYLSPNLQHYNVYRKLNNYRFNQFMQQIRERMSGEGSSIEKQSLLRKMIQLKHLNQPHTIGLISDQKPRPEVTRFWCDFLHQDTGWLDGGDVLARKFGYPVFYVHMSQLERGHYVAHPQLITDDPTNTPDNYITEQFVQRLESNIRENPSLWLWSHNRWKWGRSGKVQEAGALNS